MTGQRGGKRSTSFTPETAKAARAKPRRERLKFEQLVADLPEDLSKAEFAEFCRRKLAANRDILDKALATAGERMAAIKFLAERGYGQPTQPVEMSGPEGSPIEHVWAMTADQRDERLRALLEKVSGGG